MPEVFTISGPPLGAAVDKSMVRALQNALRALGRVAKDKVLAGLVIDGAVGPATRAAVSKAFYKYVTNDLAPAWTRSGGTFTAGQITGVLNALVNSVTAEVVKRGGTIPSASPPPPPKKPAAAPRSPEISPEAISEEPSFFSRPGVKIGIGVGAGVLLLSVIGVLLAKKPASPAMAGDLGATKKDYVAFANMLCQHGASPSLVGDVADYFERDNPRFARTLFLRATEKCTPIRRAA